MIKYEEILTADELLAIHNKVMENVLNIFDKQRTTGSLFIGYCSYCHQDIPQKHRLREPVITSPLDMSCECASCYARRREKELLDEAVKAKKPKLDVNDFSKV